MNPWDRLPNESPRAFEAFCTFRDLGPSRSLPEAYRKLTGKETPRASGMWGVWYRCHDWRSRAEAYDVELDRIRQAKRRQLVEEMTERHGEAFKRAVELADRALRALLDRDAFDPADLALARAAKMWASTLDIVARAERLIGEPTSIQKPAAVAGDSERPLSAYVDELIDELVREGKL